VSQDNDEIRRLRGRVATLETDKRVLERLPLPESIW